MTREFEEIVVEYPPEDLCTYPEYKGKPYFSIKYKEGNEHFIGYGTYKPEIFSRFLRDYFMPSVTPQEPRWIPVNERVAEFPCLACDIFDQIFIPSGIVVLNSRCYEGKDFDFNVEKFLRGKEVIMCGGKKAYLRPREIAAWMPLPKPYEPQESEE